MRTITLLTLLACLAGALHASYTATTITKDNAMLDLTATGTNRTSQFVQFAATSSYGLHDEGKLDNVPLGFNFTFFGVVYTTVDISANCFLSFTDINYASYAVMPNTPALASQPNNFIMGAAGDYGFIGAAPGTAFVYTQTLGSVGDREFRVQWKGWQAIIGGDPVDVIIRLFENGSSIEVHPIVGTGGTLSGGRIISGIEDATGARAVPCLQGWTEGQYPPSAWRWVPKAGPEIELYRANGVNQANFFQHPMEDREQGTPFTHTYRICNAGNADLVISGNVTFQAGSSNCTGQVLNQPASLTIAPGNDEYLTVQVTPTSAAASSFLATFHIPSNDSNEGTFYLMLAGYAVTSAVPDVDIPPAPGIVLTYDNLAGGRLFHEVGRLTKGTVYTYTYTIYNTAAGTLNLTGSPDRVTIGASNCMCNVTQQPPASIAGYSSATFTVTIETTGGDIFGSIGVPNSDPDFESGWGNILVGVGVDPMLADIELQRPAGTPRPSGSTDSFGSVSAGTPISRTYTVANTGTAGLSLTGTPSVEFDQITNCTPVLTSGPALFITNGSTTTFDIEVTPGSGAFSCRMIVRSDDGDENPYTLILSGSSAAAPEINVQRGASIPDGATDTVSGALAGVPTNLTYTIQNLGAGNLTLTGASPVSSSNPVNISGPIIIAQPGTLVLAPSTSTTFSVAFTPLASGTFSFELDILSDDGDEGNYDIDVTGAASVPDIDVRNVGGGSILNGGTDSISGAVGVLSSRSYSIFNVGGANLGLAGGSPVSVSATVNLVAGVNITQPAGATITPGNSLPFTLEYTPAAAGGFSFLVTIANNDPDESPFTFTVSGNAIMPAGEIEVLRGLASVLNLSVDFLGSAHTGGMPFVLVYTISNSGTSTLNLTGLPPVALANAVGCSAVVTMLPATVILAGGTTSFEVTVTPVSLGGGFSFEVSIANDDGDENPYAFSASGSATGIGGVGGGGGGGGGGGCAAATGSAFWLLALLPLLALRKIRVTRAQN